MHFPKYWTTVRDKHLMAWGWSDHSLAEATGRATERLARIKDWWARGRKTPLQQQYGYADDRPLCEEVLQEFRAAEGTLRAAITRNRYGCLVLNTADLMFVDVDAPEAKESGWLAGLFGFRQPDHTRDPDAFMNTLLARVQDWVARTPTWGWRVYRTAAGVRLVATHEPFASDHTMCQTAFAVFEADPLYRKLCAVQKCFRARLTPKPWRCDADKLHIRWPRGDKKWEARFRSWEAEYNKAAARYATCQLVGQFGNAQFHPALRELIELHDRVTQVGKDLRLA
ncbi:MAG: hypothetical protein AAB370_02535 [Verrucomicrobiota bacterium]